MNDPLMLEHAVSLAPLRLNDSARRGARRGAK